MKCVRANESEISDLNNAFSSEYMSFVGGRWLLGKILTNNGELACFERLLHNSIQRLHNFPRGMLAARRLADTF
jgi:hypothetical protein